MNDFFMGEWKQTSMGQILIRREERSRQQRELLTRCPCVISFTMNIPGAQKMFPLAGAGFREGLEQISSALLPALAQECVEYAGAAGREALLALRADPATVKRSMIRLEQEHPLGRLWDIDVLDRSGRSLSRTDLGEPPRRCILCGNDARVCARSRAHDIQELFAAVYQQLDDFFCVRTETLIADSAEAALLDEVAATPKPGLVDRRSSGAHRDMDYALFLRSAQALVPWFREFAHIGWRTAAQDEDAVFMLLRAAGQKAESAMFHATGGVNTHKGLIFSAAVLCAAMARLQAQRCESVGSRELSAQCARLAQCALKDFFGGAEDTNGLRLYRQYRIAGVRGEAAAGFPSVFHIGYPALQLWLDRGVSLNDAAAAALVHLLAAVEDTNLIHRGGYSAAAACRVEAQQMIGELTPESLHRELERMDERYTQGNLSPGGCADLLALSLLLHGLASKGLLRQPPTHEESACTVWEQARPATL